MWKLWGRKAKAQQTINYTLKCTLPSLYSLPSQSAVEFSSNARAPRPDPSTISPSHTHTQQHPSTTGTAPATGGMLSAQLEVFHHSFANMQLVSHSTSYSGTPLQWHPWNGDTCVIRTPLKWGQLSNKGPFSFPKNSSRCNSWNKEVDSPCKLRITRYQ